jgi:hypothetical protein
MENFGDFDDDFFDENKPKKKENDLIELIKNYQVKIVEFEVQ